MDKGIKLLSGAAFAAGLVIIGWIGIGYIDSSPLALAMTGLIALAYIAGGVELLRFQQATAALAQAVAGVAHDLSSLGDWLQRLPVSLQNAVRLRVEGERVALPGPTLAPYLVGLLVLLGMLGTFLGMVVTLNGAVFALEGTSDLQAMRAAMAAPVKGLGVAFGTSVAGVAASAMLGLVSALCRRERLRVGQLLDTRIATTLRGFSLVHQRQEAFAALQSQARALPDVVDTLQAMMAQMERHSRELNERLVGENRELRTDLIGESRALNERLVGEQERFYREARGSYSELATTVGQSMQALKAELTSDQTRFYRQANESYAELAAIVSTSVKTLSEQLVSEQVRFYTEAKGHHAELAASVGQSVQALESQLGAEQTRFYGDAQAGYSELSAAIGRSLQALQTQLIDEQTRFHSDARTNYAGLASALTESLQALNAQLLEEQQRFHGDARDSYTALGADVGASLQANLAESVRAVGAAIEPLVATTLNGVVEETAALQQEVAETVSQQLDRIAVRFDNSVSTVADTWTAALAAHEQTSTTVTRQLQTSLQGFADSFDQRASALVVALREQGAALQSELAVADQARQAELAQTIETLGTALQQEWRDVSVRTLAQQEQLCAALGETTREIVGTAQAQASSTIAEVARLMETAAEAPRAAAEVIGELRHELTASMARDNELLAERARIMATLDTLLTSIEQMSTAQREAIDGLVTTSAAMLERAGGQFERRVDAESSRIEAIAGQLTTSAVEVASLGEAFGTGVQRFAEANNELMTTLARIEGALDKSAARSDEQLAYYVGQAREIIDLSLMSQRRIIDELQQRAGELAPAASEA